MPKIYLSPEDRASNTYHAAALYQGRQTNEREQMCRCADYMEASLTRCGFTVRNVQSGNMYDRVKESNEWPSDMHIALHTNGFDGTVAGTRVHCYPSDASRKIGKLIQDRIAPMSPGKSEGLRESATLYELRATHMVAVLPEFGFHDNSDEAAWLVDSMEQISEETVKAVCDYYGVAYVPAEAVDKLPIETDEKLQEDACGITIGYVMPTLRKGDSGAQVKALQALLNGYGYGCGKVDGGFGVKTDSAVKSYQAVMGMAVDGVCGDAVWRKLLGW